MLTKRPLRPVRAAAVFKKANVAAGLSAEIVSRLMKKPFELVTEPTSKDEFRTRVGGEGDGDGTGKRGL